MQVNFLVQVGETRYRNLCERPGSVRRSTSNRDRNFRARAKLVHVKTSGPRTNTKKKNYNVSVLIITWYDTTTD